MSTTEEDHARLENEMSEQQEHRLHTPPDVQKEPILETVLQCSSRERHPIDRWVSYEVFSIEYHPYLFALQHEHEPISYKQAFKDHRWIEAINEEMAALNENYTWKIMDRPIGKNVVGCKWVYKIKRRADGSVERYKARLVEKGYTQEYRLGYDETFSPIIKMETIRRILALAVTYGWHLHQMDVKNAFLHGI